MAKIDENALNYPKPTGTLEINENFHIAIYGKMPNRFRRFMARLLLGWKYTEVRDGKNN